jgi:hypothetical protein
MGGYWLSWWRLLSTAALGSNPDISQNTKWATSAKEWPAKEWPAHSSPPKNIQKKLLLNVRMFECIVCMKENNNLKRMANRYHQLCHQFFNFRTYSERLTFNNTFYSLD